jgi:dipeptidyl aminopeptidase/acylaminoacyl peptidase
LLSLLPAVLFASEAPPIVGPPILAPPDNLVAEGLPPIEHALVDEVARYTEARAATFADWHPSERRLLISTRFANVRQIHQVSAPGGARRQLTFFTEPVNTATYDPRDGAFLLFLKDRGGDEFAQIYRQDLADGRVTLLSDGGRSQNGGIDWSTAGDRIAYASTRRNGADRDIYVMDPRDPSTDRLVVEVAGGGWQVLDWSPDDRRLLILEYVSVTESRIHEVDLQTGERRRVAATDEPVAWRAAEYTADGRRAIVITDRGGDFSYLAELDLASGEMKRLSHAADWDVAAFALSTDRSRIAYELNEAGQSRLYLMEVAGGVPRPVANLPVGTLGRFAFHRTRGELAFSMVTTRSPADVYSLDVASGALERWTASEVGPVVLDDLPDPRLVRWNSFDGLEITGFLYPPARHFTGKRPVIVSIHGGPESQATPGFQGRWNYFLNELGVAILEPNVRGSSGYGRRFVALDNAENREDSVKDIGALLDWIAAQPDLDGSRVMIEGGSYGGYMALAVSTLYSDRIVGAIDVVGISHFGTFLQNTEDYRRDLRRVEYGDERDPDIQALFERISPLRNAARIKKPLFVVQGANDPRVPASEAEQMVATIRGGGTPVWYLLGKDEGHGFAKKENADFQFYATVEFVKRYLLAP